MRTRLSTAPQSGQSVRGGNNSGIRTQLFTCNFCIFVRKCLLMDRKLTLSLNSSIIDKAKGYAKSHGTSLSKMIESYLSSVVSEETDEESKYTPTVNRLIGIIDVTTINYDDFKADYSNFLSEKYR